jgi:hypothetical protein
VPRLDGLVSNSNAVLSQIVCGKGQSEQGNYSTDHQHCGRLRSAK